MDKNLLNSPKPTIDYSTLLKLPDSDDVRCKQIIKEQLLSNQDVLYLLNAENETLEIDDYFGKYVLPYYVIDETNTMVHNYLCYEISFDSVPVHNTFYKDMQIIFYICIDKKNVIEPTSGIARHDLIAALIQRDINWSSCFGMQCSLVSDRPSTTDLNYVTRTLIFECTTPRNVSVSDEEGSHIVNFELWE